MGAENDNEPETTGPHEPALLAFAVNVEFVKRLVAAQGADGFRPPAVVEVRNWVTILIQGAQAYLDANEDQEGATPELMLLARQIDEALAWLDAFD